ncbi:MAG: serine/threonine protein kinase [Halioglobus sp.]|nr:serine/threonine protein kinase [Halioglobus sp.]
MSGDAMVGPYRILRLINRGGQGSLFLGYDKRLRRRVAIKIYSLPTERKARKRLLHEAQLVARMQSPKIVQMHDVIESSEHLAMVMEYVPGCDLEELLASVRPSLASVLAIATDIAGALAIARQQHIVHGDLKAANVLVGTNGRVKLTDFGIARQSDAGQWPGGSPSAMSPEQYLGKPLDHRSDLFALGCLLYRMLSGVQPFYRDGKLDARALLEQTPAPLEDIVAPDVELPAELTDMVAALLEKNPADRPPGTRTVRQVLRRVARAMPLAAGDSLMDEARPCFRPESEEDIPPAVPPGLGRGGRSRLVHSRLADVRSRLLAKLRAWRWPAVLAGIALAAGVVYLLKLPPTRLRVHIDAPVIRLATSVKLPREITGRWLVDEVTGAMSERLGPLWVTGPVGATPVTTLYGDPALREPPAPEEQLQLGLRCVDLLCVFAVTRNWQDRQLNRQAVLFPDMTSRQWRDVIRTTIQGMYP